MVIYHHIVVQYTNDETDQSGYWGAVAHARAIYSIFLTILK